mgnify:CR=1 FL=1
MSADDLHDAIPADYLAGHPDAPEGADDGHLSVADGALTFSAEVITGMTIGRVAFAMPLDAVRSLSVLDRGTAGPARPVLRAGAAAGAVGVFLATSRPLRERLLLVDLGEGTVAVFALTMAGAVRLLVADLIVVEWLFGWPGLGFLMAATLIPAQVASATVDAGFLDPPLVASLLTIFAAIFLITDLLAGALARAADPRQRV